MKQLRFTVMMLFALQCATIYAQLETNNWNVDTTDSFNDAHCPFGNGLTMWTLKQKYTIDAMQFLISTEIPVEDSYDAKRTRFHIEGFMPLFKYKSISSMIGANYHKFYTMAENDSLNQALQDVCSFWFPVQFNYNSLKVTFLYEQFYRSDRNNLFAEIGKTERYFAMVAYAFNSKWQATIFGAYIKTKMVNDERTMMMPAFQLRYQPNERFKMTFGAPVIYAMEWQINQKFDLYVSQLMIEETDMFLRYRFHKKAGISLHYKSSNYGMSDIYFPNKSMLLNGEPVSYNKLDQFQNSIALKLGIKTFDNVGLIFTGGYNIGNKLKLHNNTTELGTANGANEFYFGVAVQYLKYF